MKAFNSTYLAALTLLFFLSGAAPSEAKSYRWIDDRGVVHFSDKRPVTPPVKTKAKLDHKSSKKPPAKPKFYDFREKVVKTLDVDTIQLQSGKVVKYIGVKDPSGFMKGKVSKEKMRAPLEFHRKLVEGKVVTVLLGKKKRDRRGYFMGHVFLGRDIFVNAELIKSGYALTEEYPGDFAYQSLFIRLLKDARKRRAGIWNF